jgi:hypothetical protein
MYNVKFKINKILSFFLSEDPTCGSMIDLGPGYGSRVRTRAPPHITTLLKRKGQPDKGCPISLKGGSKKRGGLGC